jgi:hypothetical protein
LVLFFGTGSDDAWRGVSHPGDKDNRRGCCGISRQGPHLRKLGGATVQFSADRQPGIEKVER